MPEAVPSRFESRSIPDDWRDDSLHAAALWVNREQDIPAIFPDDSLAYLWDLGYSLPRRGFLFINAARGFIFELTIGTLSESDAEMVRNVYALRQRKEDAIANRDFETARDCRDQEDGIRARVSQCPVHQITCNEIRNSLLRVGVDPDAQTQATTKATTKGTLIIGVLTIESSYAQNTERPSRGVPDTLQFWIGPDSAWRIRTYATDHDIHPHSLGDLGKMKDRPTESARDHIEKHYGDVLASTVVLEFPDTSDTNSVRRLLAQHKLTGNLEVARIGFAFWNPDDGHYKSQTTPK